MSKNPSKLTDQQLKLLSYTQAVLKPKPKMTGVEWADKYFYLSLESSASPGKWTTLPYQIEPINCMTDETTEQTTWWKSARVGYTKCINIAVGYHIHQNPASILLAQPTEGEAFGYAEDEIEPMIRDNDVIYDVIGKTTKKGKSKREKTAKKTYPGGILELVGAHSPKNFRRRTVRIFIGDEIDGWEQQAGQEGDQIALGKKRTNDFWNRKIILGSSPGVEQLSKIKPEFKQGDQRYYNVLCPHCGHFHKLEWSNFVMPRDEEGELIENEVGFSCPKCGSVYTEDHKISMIEKGKWIATKPFKGHASFHIWAAYSYNANSSWVAIAKEWFEAQGNQLKLKTFIMLTLGETWEENFEKVDESKFNNRCEIYNAVVPDGVLILTAGVDTQDDRLECEVVGWGKYGESWSIGYFVLDGDPKYEKVWAKLDKLLLEQTYRHESGIDLKVMATCIDTGGHRTKYVYGYCKKRFDLDIFAIKGDKAIATPIVKGNPTRNNKGKIPLFSIGVNTTKDVVHTHILTEEEGSGFMHFPKREKGSKEFIYDEKYFKQLTAEKRTDEGRWVKFRTRNEALDVRVYSIAALEILEMIYYPVDGIDWDILEDELLQKIEEELNNTQIDEETGEVTNDFNDWRDDY